MNYSSFICYPINVTENFTAATTKPPTTKPPTKLACTIECNQKNDAVNRAITSLNQAYGNYITAKTNWLNTNNNRLIANPLIVERANSLIIAYDNYQLAQCSFNVSLNKCAPILGTKPAADLIFEYSSAQNSYAMANINGQLFSYGPFFNTISNVVSELEYIKTHSPNKNVQVVEPALPVGIREILTIGNVFDKIFHKIVRFGSIKNGPTLSTLNLTCPKLNDK